jgi:predicted RNase H-like nuclease (RuvC/YqgF family)
MPSKTEYKKTIDSRNSDLRHKDFEIRKLESQVRDLKRENNELVTLLHARKWWQFWK